MRRGSGLNVLEGLKSRAGFRAELASRADEFFGILAAGGHCRYE